MCYKVSFHLVGLTEALPTDRTTERFLTCVDSQVYRQVGGLIEPFSTDMALIGLLPCVNPLVTFQPPRRAKGLTTQAAEKWLLFHVHLHVCV